MEVRVADVFTGMHNKTKLIGAALAALFMLPATSQAAAPASVTGNATVGVQYIGTDSPDTVSFTTVGGKLVVDNNGPLTAFQLCSPVAGDPTKATCPLPTRLDASAQDGRDAVSNSTSIPLHAFGGEDDDTLVGGSGNDELNGGAGNDTVRGRLGRDFLSGGDGANDTVSYSDRSTSVTVFIEGFTSKSGAPGEKDNVFGDFENIAGGSGSDFLFGNALSNVLAGGVGDDTLIGFGGADILVGADGSDQLLSNNEFAGLRRDFAADILRGGNDGGRDTCGFSTLDGDDASQCEATA